MEQLAQALKARLAPFGVLAVPVHFTDNVTTFARGQEVFASRLQLLRSLVDPDGFERLMLHEQGHCWFRRNERDLVRDGIGQVFGDFGAPYPAHEMRWTAMAAAEPLQPEAYVSPYAEVHAHEDVAETFAEVILGGERHDEPVASKLAFVRRALERYP